MPGLDITEVRRLSQKLHSPAQNSMSVFTSDGAIIANAPSGESKEAALANNASKGKAEQWRAAARRLSGADFPVLKNGGLETIKSYLHSGQNERISQHTERNLSAHRERRKFLPASSADSLSISTASITASRLPARIARSTPSAEQHAVGTDFHRALPLLNLKLPELENIVHSEISF